jgi:hydrogenase expression/formation protein HypC
MCIGLPMQITRIEPGHAWCQGRGEQRRVNTALVGPCEPGDWLLVFLDGARERISPERACEIDTVLDMLGDVMQGLHPAAPGNGLGFELPSAMSAQQVAALAGQSNNAQE